MELAGRIRSFRDFLAGVGGILEKKSGAFHPSLIQIVHGGNAVALFEAGHQIRRRYVKRFRQIADRQRTVEIPVQILCDRLEILRNRNILSFQNPVQFKEKEFQKVFQKIAGADGMFDFAVKKRQIFLKNFVGVVLIVLTDRLFAPSKLESSTHVEISRESHANAPLSDFNGYPSSLAGQRRKIRPDAFKGKKTRPKILLS